MPESREHGFDVAKLYPDLTPEEQAEAGHNLSRYLDVVQRIFERTEGLTPSDPLDE